jgi:hypothetical protein
MIVPFIIQHPEPRALSFDPPTDIENLIKDFLSGGRVFHEDDLQFISYQIQTLINHYKQEAYDARVYDDVNKIKYFIRVLNYGVNFNFIVMVLHNFKQYNIYYE